MTKSTNSSRLSRRNAVYYNKSGAHNTLAYLHKKNWRRVMARDVMNQSLREFALAVGKKMRGIYFLARDGSPTLHVGIEGENTSAGRIGIDVITRGLEDVDVFCVNSDFIRSGPVNSANYHTKQSKNLLVSVRTACKALRVHTMQELCTDSLPAFQTKAIKTVVKDSNNLRASYSKIVGITYAADNNMVSSFVEEMESIITSGYKFATNGFRTEVYNLCTLHNKLIEARLAQDSSFYYAELVRNARGVTTHVKWLLVDNFCMVDKIYRASVADLPSGLQVGMSLMAMATEDKQYIEGAGYRVNESTYYVVKK